MSAFLKNRRSKKTENSCKFKNSLTFERLVYVFFVPLHPFFEKNKIDRLNRTSGAA